MRTPSPAGTFQCSTRPACGAKPLNASSAHSRASIAWPCQRICSCCSGKGSPRAMRNCHSTRSSPVMASVTGCSTCSRVFISRKWNCAVGREQVFHRAGADIADLAHQLHGGGAQALAQLGRHAGGGRFFQDLLVAALRGAVALAQVDGAAVGVAEDLHLDVARFLDQALQQQVAVAEGGHGFGARRGQQFAQLRVVDVVAAAHAAAAAAGAGLDHQRRADAAGLGHQRVDVLRRARIARQAGHADALRQLLGRGLVAQRVDGLGRGPDEDDAGLAAGTREVGVLRQEAVARMHRTGAGALAGIDDQRDVQVAVPRRSGAQAQRGVGQLHMARVAVGVGVHRHRAQAHGAGSADHAAGDLAAVGDQKRVKHQPHPSGAKYLAIERTPRNRL